MDCAKAIKYYVTKMVGDTSGMKVLLLDQWTTPIISMVYTQSDILQQEVYLLEKVANQNREVMTHLKAVVFVRPVKESIDALVAELKRPKYGQYDLYFSHIIKPAQLERLAEADEHEVVREVQEYFADYLALDKSLVTFNVTGCIGPNAQQWNQSAFTRIHQGLVAQLLALKKKPIIRYQGSSDLCRKLAEDISGTINREHSLFDFRVGSDIPSILLVLDRRDDPVTPLLNQWTYQAMVHELLGIDNNKVDMSKVKGVPKEMQQIVLAANDSDQFFQSNMFNDFGMIGDNIRKLVEDFQERTKSHEKMESIADMKEFVENYPQFRAFSGSVSKHVSVVGELSRQADAYNLFELSQTEQELACHGSHSNMVQEIRDLLKGQKLRDFDRVRLVMIYALRYATHSSSELDSFYSILEQQGVDGARERVKKLLKYAGEGQPGRSSDLFGTKGAAGLFKKMTGGLKGVENVYIQHNPLLSSTLDSLAKGKLKEASFPFSDKQYLGKPQDIVVFIVGGCTYSEARAVEKFNAENPSMRVVLGGSSVHNTRSFLDEIDASLSTR